METTAPELGRDAQARLETFLGGMETRSRIGTFAALAGLETFLGGMETEKTFPRRGRPVVP